VKTVKEFVALALSKPGELNYGITGLGAANRMVTELFDGKAGIKITHIPYRGTALAVADLLAGQVPSGVCRSDLRPSTLQVRHVDRPCRHEQGALGGGSHGADDIGKRLSGFRCRWLARHSGAGQNGARDRRHAETS